MISTGTCQRACSPYVMLKLTRLKNLLWTASNTRWRRAGVSHLYLLSNFLLRLVKWYHSWFGTKERKFDSCIGDQQMQRWRSGPTHGIANPKNRQFESDPLLQQERPYVWITEGYLGWAQHCLENRWIADAVGVRFYHPSSITASPTAK